MYTLRTDRSRDRLPEMATKNKQRKEEEEEYNPPFEMMNKREYLLYLQCLNLIPDVKSKGK